MDGRLFTQLTSMPVKGALASVRYLNSQDLKRIVSESTSNLVGSIVTDSDYVDVGDDISVSKLIDHVLSSEAVSTQEFRPQMWESVFWDPSWARPDRVASYLNKMLEKNELDARNLILSEEGTAQVGACTDLTP